MPNSSLTSFEQATLSLNEFPIEEDSLVIHNRKFDIASKYH